MALEGLCTISQRDFYLSEHNGHAVTTVVGGEDIKWRLTYQNTAPISKQLTIALTSGPLAESSSVVNVLTVGKRTEEEGIQIYLEPLQDPPSKGQLWTMEDVLGTKR